LTAPEERSRNEIRTPRAESKNARLGVTEELLRLTGPGEGAAAAEVEAIAAIAVSVARVEPR
jgi:hypothetical protein